jgi:flagellar basal-body rod protein FlgG
VTAETQQRDLVNYTGDYGTTKKELGSMSFGVQIDDVYTSFTQGNIAYSGLRTDLAIDGEGFLEVQMPDGTTGYTRNGSLQINENNQLATLNGGLVLDQNGNTITITDPDFSVGTKGALSQNGTITNTISIVAFADNTALEDLGYGFYSGAGGVQSTDFELVQGYYEESNYEAVDEMVRMISLSREFESNQQVLSTINSSYEKTVNQLGKV